MSTGTFSLAKKAKKDALRLRWNSSVERTDHLSVHVHSAIEQLAKIIRNKDELRQFLSAEKGFRSEQFDGFGSSLIHYVAGREFDSAEEADQWLTYANVQKNQDIEMKSVLLGHRPLHCACKWGNIFGVQWLVNHGANVNVKDKAGNSYACLSFVDTMKKMLYLEDHGYILSQSDIGWGAKNQFSSFEEANEMFNYLVNEKGLSVNATNHYGETPLHRACRFGSIFGVKWLMEHHADINSVDLFGETPFINACQSCINRSAKVRYLDEKGANCRAKDPEGRTALFYAVKRSINPSKSEDDEVKDVLRYLVIEKGIDVNSVDEEGRSPVLEACYQHPSCLVIQQLIELGADVSVRNRKKENALHMVAKCYSSADASVIDLLIKKGVDVTCQDQNKNTPYEVAYHGETRALLRQHYNAARFSVLQREMVRTDSIKSCVVGPEMAGKTTYVNSLLQLNQPSPKEKDRTPGVDIHNCEKEEVGKGSWWDFGSQPTFHSAHGLFFQKSNTVFTLVLPIRGNISPETFGRLLGDGQFWCAFTKASMRTRLSDKKSLIRLVVIFNLIGFNEEEGFKVCVKLKQVAKQLQEKFQKTFDILHVIEMDCSKSQSDFMKDCREKMKRIREEMLMTADDVPKLCHSIEEYLSLPDEKRKSPFAYFLTIDEFEKWVADEVGITLNEDEKKVAVEYLESSGIIIKLGRRICVRPVWLCRNVIGPLLAPDWFPFSLPREKFGKASKEDIKSALSTFESYLSKKGTPSPFEVTADEAIEVLFFLELCIPLEGEMYQITALLKDEIPAKAWPEDPTFDVYRGQRYECAESVDIISPSSFVTLQSRCSRMNNVSHIVWKDGIRLLNIVGSKVILCLITMGIKKERHCIDVVLRWSSKNQCEAAAKEFLDELKSMIAKVCDERSPGVILNWFYLDSSQLKQLNSDPAVYSSREVDQKVRGSSFDDKIFSIRPEGDNYICIGDLVIFAPEIAGPVSDGLLNQSIACSGNWSHEVDLCLVAVNGSEVQAARAVLEKATGNTISPPHDHPKKDSSGLGVVTLDIHWPNFFIKKEANVRPFQIALITPSSEGREETFQLVNNLFQTALSPSVIAMVGCCAGRKESDVHLGDVMVPFKITRNSGKKLHSGERDANAEYIELDDDLKKMVSVDAKSNNSDWLDLIPEKLRATPCPVDLQNSILAESELAERGTKDVDVHEALLRKNDKWDPKLITLDVLEEAVQHLVDEGYVVTDKEKGFIWRTEKECARKRNAGPRQKPKLHTMNVYSGDVVNESLDFCRLAKEVGQAELAGYDMEGYAFFHSVRSNGNRAKAIFVKGVSNFGSKKSRMDYYKKYCAASATAFVCHLLKAVKASG